MSASLSLPNAVWKVAVRWLARRDALPEPAFNVLNRRSATRSALASSLLRNPWLGGGLLLGGLLLGGLLLGVALQARRYTCSR